MQRVVILFFAGIFKMNFFNKRIYVTNHDFIENALDNRLMCFDERIHDKRALKDNNGNWVYKKTKFSFKSFKYEIDINLIAKIEHELKLKMLENNYSQYISSKSLYSVNLRRLDLQNMAPVIVQIKNS